MYPRSNRWRNHVLLIPTRAQAIRICRQSQGKGDCSFDAHSSTKDIGQWRYTIFVLRRFDVLTSTIYKHVQYVLYNPRELWATCSCIHAQRDNTCKHKMKILRLLHLNLTEGIVTRHYGALKGSTAAGLGHFFTPIRSASQDVLSGLHSTGVASLFSTLTLDEVSLNTMGLGATLDIQT